MPKFRGALEIRYEVQGDTSSIGASPKTLFATSFSCKTFLFPLVGQIANPVLVDNTLNMRCASVPSLAFSCECRV